MNTWLVFIAGAHQPPGGGNAWVAFWHAVCSWQVQDNHFTTPMKFPNKLFAECQSGFTLVRCDCMNLQGFLYLFCPPLPPLSSSSSSSSSRSLPSLLWQLLFLIFSLAISRDPSGAAESEGLMWEQCSASQMHTHTHTHTRTNHTCKHTWSSAPRKACANCNRGLHLPPTWANDAALKQEALNNHM